MRRARRRIARRAASRRLPRTSSYNCADAQSALEAQLKRDRSSWKRYRSAPRDFRLLNSRALVRIRHGARSGGR